MKLVTRKVKTRVKKNTWYIDLHPEPVFHQIHFYTTHKKSIDNKCLFILYVLMISVLDYNEDTKQHTLSVKFRFPLFDDKFDWLKNKDGSFKRDRNGQRIPKITEGESHLTNPFTPHYLLNRN